MAEIFQADYEELKAAATRFQNQSEATVQMQALLSRALASLKDGGWIGRGSDAFFAEVESEVIPAARRLSEAMAEAASVTNQIVGLIDGADQEAATPFRDGESGGSSTTPSPAGGSTGGTPSGGGSGSSSDGGAVTSPPDGTSGVQTGGDDYGIPEDWLSDVTAGLPNGGGGDSGLQSDWLKDVEDAFGLENGSGSSGGGSGSGGGSDMASAGTRASGMISGMGSGGSTGGSMGSGAGSGAGSSGSGGGSLGGMQRSGSGGGSAGGIMGSSGSGSSSPSSLSYQTPSEAGFRSGMSDYTSGNSASMGYVGSGSVGSSGGATGTPLGRADAVVGSAEESGGNSFAMPLGIAAASPFLALFGKALRDQDDDE